MAWLVAGRVISGTAFCGLAGPATQSLMTRLVSSAEQGRLQGAMANVKEAIEGWLEVMEAKRVVDAERTVEVVV
ncbi:MAG: hypothetical protein NTAFB01_15750 [Nitrospira sp.]